MKRNQSVTIGYSENHNRLGEAERPCVKLRVKLWTIVEACDRHCEELRGQE